MLSSELFVNFEMIDQLGNKMWAVELKPTSKLNMNFKIIGQIQNYMETQPWWFAWFVASNLFNLTGITHFLIMEIFATAQKDVICQVQV